MGFFLLRLPKLARRLLLSLANKTFAACSTIRHYPYGIVGKSDQ